MHGGDDCEGEMLDEESCNEEPCAGNINSHPAGTESDKSLPQV